MKTTIDMGAQREKQTYVVGKCNKKEACKRKAYKDK
jgi:hypothetical protein